ncbi:MAG TPA: TonB-dependent receptor plug domain-containing protein, partial [Propionibacteriaceae bacterium]|nr:TonB-dependent receptor plug domain-containing protein [Propionibacteriaceae bacterium]
ASAQEQPSSGATLEEVIVTATKREERLQDVPESITAIDSDAILKRGLFQMDDYARLVPGLSISDREPGGTTIVFRGVATSGLQFGSVSSSALYLDEQPITQSGRNPDPRLIDVERVEALRGPQGTLYGASSQSGTLRIITNKPDPSKLETWFDAQLSSVHDGGTGYDLSAMLNVPLVADRLALRLVGFTAEDAGFIDNVLSDSQGTTFDNANVVKKDVNTTKTTGGRAALGLKVTDNVQATLSAVFQDLHADGHGDVNHGAGDLHQVRFEDENLDDHWYQLALTLDASLPFGQAVVAASYFNRELRYEADATDYEFQFNQSFINCDPAVDDCTPTYDFGGDPRGFAINREDTEITTLEARLSSKTGSESRWAWLVGAFYSDEKGKTAFDSFVRGYENTPSFAYFNYYETRLTGNPL